MAMNKTILNETIPDEKVSECITKIKDHKRYNGSVILEVCVDKNYLSQFLHCLTNDSNVLSVDISSIGLLNVGCARVEITYSEFDALVKE